MTQRDSNQKKERPQTRNLDLLYFGFFPQILCIHLLASNWCKTLRFLRTNAYATVTLVKIAFFSVSIKRSEIIQLASIVTRSRIAVVLCVTLVSLVLSFRTIRQFIDYK